MRFVRFFWTNLGAVAIAVALFLAFGWIARKDVPRDLPVTLPDGIVTGGVGEWLEAGGLRVRVEAVERFDADDLPEGLRLSARAQQRDGDVVVVTLAVANLGDAPRSFVWLGRDETVRVRLGTRRPLPALALPVTPRDVRQITGLEPMEGEVAPHDERSGRLAFLVRPPAAELSLLLLGLPEAGAGEGAEEPPSFEIALGG